MALGDYEKTTYVNGSAPGLSAQNLNKNENKTEELDNALVTHLAETATLRYLNADWSVSTTNPLRDTIAKRGCLYVADYNGNIIKFDQNGKQLLKFYSGHGTIYGIEVDSSDNIYILVSGGYLVKFNSSGQQMFSVYVNNGSSTVMFMDNGDNLFFSDNNGEIQKRNTADGTEDWRYDTGSSRIFEIQGDGSNIYICCNDNTVKKIDASGNLVWSFTTKELPRTIALDMIGNVHIGEDNFVVEKVFQSNGAKAFEVTRSFSEILYASAFCAFGRNLYFFGYKKINVIDFNTGNIVSNINFNGFSSTSRISFDKDFSACYGVPSNSIHISKVNLPL